MHGAHGYVTNVGCLTGGGGGGGRPPDCRLLVLPWHC